MSRTVRLTPRATAGPDSSAAGPALILPREGLRPTSPQSAAGIRIEPDPSEACATGTNPAATAAVAPPLEPPVERSRFHGLRVGPQAVGSVVAMAANSGVFVRPAVIRPAARNLATRVESASARGPRPFSRALPFDIGAARCTGP